jgi:hypothetical protein
MKELSFCGGHGAKDDSFFIHMTTLSFGNPALRWMVIQDKPPATRHLDIPIPS